MANLYPPPHPTAIGFGPNTVPHTPASLGFGFGLSGASSVPAHNSPRHFSPHPSMSMAAPTGGNSPLRHAQKRRHEPEDEEDDDDQPTTRNPMHNASDRPRRTLAKRLRMTPTDSAESSRNGQKDGKNRDNSERDIDVGVLLASIPTQSLLPLLTSLLSAQPSLRPLLLSLIPRPSLETSLKALAESAKRLRDAYPYSTQQPSSSFGFGTAPSTSFGFGAAPAPSTSFGSGFGSANRPAGGFGFGFGAQPSRSSPTPPSVGGMRDNYVLSRVRPAIQEYHTTAQSYLPYFSLAPTASNALPALSNQSPTHGPSSFQQQRSTLPKPHPTETFSFLVALTQHITSFPPLLIQPQSGSNGSGSTLLTDHLIPRLLQEWSAWVDYIDNYVNRESGMFSEDVVRGWSRSLDEFAGDGSSYLNHTFGTVPFHTPQHNQHNNSTTLPGMKEIRDKWVARVGWLIGRVPPPPGFATGGVPIEMEEEEEL